MPKSQIDYANDITFNIDAISATFLTLLDTEITEIEIIPVDNSEDAFKLINNKDEKIVLLLLDIELKAGAEGHLEYDKLFLKGKAIPAIVISAFATTPKRIESIHSKGISIIIDKWKTEKLSEEIIRNICVVLGNRVEQIIQIRNYVERLRIQNKMVTINDKNQTVQDWMKLIIAEENSNEEIIISALTQECINAFRIESDHGKGFARQE